MAVSRENFSRTVAALQGHNFYVYYVIYKIWGLLSPKVQFILCDIHIRWFFFLLLWKLIVYPWLRVCANYNLAKNCSWMVFILWSEIRKLMDIIENDYILVIDDHFSYAVKWDLPSYPLISALFRNSFKMLLNFVIFLMVKENIKILKNGSVNETFMSKLKLE